MDIYPRMTDLGLHLFSPLGDHQNYQVIESTAFGKQYITNEALDSYTNLHE